MADTDLSSFFSGSVPGTVTSAATDSGSTPAWWQEFLKANIAGAVGQAQEPYQQFPGQTVASYNTSLANAQAVGDAVGGSHLTDNLPAINEATSKTLAGYDPNTTADYMNPYTQNVTDVMGQLAARQFKEQTMPAINDMFLGSGQFGSSRQEDTVLRAARDNQLSLSQAQATPLMQGYSDAQKAQLTNLGQLNTAATSGLGNIIKTAGAGEAAGQLEQNQEQANLNAAQSQFAQAQQYPWNQINNLASVLRGTNIGSAGSASTGTTSPGASQASPFNTLAASISAGAANTVKSSARGGLVALARGGRVPPRLWSGGALARVAPGAGLSGGAMRPGINPGVGLLRFPPGLHHLSSLRAA